MSDSYKVYASKDYVDEKIKEVSGSNSGYVSQDTAPDDTSVLWVDTSDDTSEFEQISIDETLTIEGAAADAKITGYEINKLSDKFDTELGAAVTQYCDENPLGMSTTLCNLFKTLLSDAQYNSDQSANIELLNAILGNRSTVLYSASNVVLDGTYYVDTGIAPFKTDIDFTIFLDCETVGTTDDGVVRIFGAINVEEPWYGITLQTTGEDSEYYAVHHIAGLTLLNNFTKSENHKVKMVVTHVAGSDIWTTKMQLDGGEVETYSASTPYQYISENMYLGKTNNLLFNGTFNEFKLLCEAVTDDKIADFFDIVTVESLTI